MRNYVLPLLLILMSCGHDKKSENPVNPAETAQPITDKPEVSLSCPTGQNPNANGSECVDSYELSRMRERLKTLQDNYKAVKALYDERDNSLVAAAASLESVVKTWNNDWTSLEKDFDALTVIAIEAKQSELNNQLRLIESQHAGFVNRADHLKSLIYSQNPVPSSEEASSILQDDFKKVLQDSNELHAKVTALKNSIFATINPLNNLSANRNDELSVRLQTRRARESF